MTPTEMVHLEHEKKINAKQKGVLNSENQQPIKLKTPTLLAIKNLILMSYMPLLDFAMP
jgi:hypothetical protein